MTAFEAITRALAACPYEATQVPVRGKGPTYVSYQLVSGKPVSASNAAQRWIATMQVDIWSRRAVAPELYPVLKALADGGITVTRWGPQMYEDDTGWHHMPITCEYAETT